MASTVIVAVRAALVAAIDALGAFDDVEVMFAYQGTTSRELAYTRESAFTQKPAGMRGGRVFRNEDGAFNFVIWVEKVGGTPEEASTRVLALGLALEEWVADNKNGTALSVTGLNWITVEGAGSLREAPGDQSSFAELVYPITYQARLT
jgi:hypothetical protein